jgi:hypothetical protein
MSEARAEPRAKIGISRINDTDDFELVHPRCVLQRRGDFEDGIELWKAGDPEGARDALRFALEGCGDNLWVHVALGKIALESFKDAELARGHFGYAFELVDRAIPKNFRGRIPRKLPGNRPFFDAVDGLAACYEALGQNKLSNEVRSRGRALGGA